jgi:hypothetical protein
MYKSKNIKMKRIVCTVADKNPHILPGGGKACDFFCAAVFL